MSWLGILTILAALGTRDFGVIDIAILGEVEFRFPIAGDSDIQKPFELTKIPKVIRVNEAGLTNGASLRSWGWKAIMISST